MVEWLKDQIEHNPLEAFPRNHTGQIRTHDQLANKWSDEIDAGRTPDLLEGFSAEDRAKLDRWAAKRRKVKSAPKPEPEQEKKT